MGLIRIALIFAVLAILYFLIKRVIPPSDYKKCGKCEGKGYWIALRGRESCDACAGSGKVPRH
jgi:hypothetical protein